MRLGLSMAKSFGVDTTTLGSDGRLRGGATRAGAHDGGSWRQRPLINSRTLPTRPAYQGIFAQ